MDFAVIKGTSLKCSRCEGALSTFPIHTYQDGTFVCGKCPLNDGSIARRNMAYESLAQHFNFACRYSSKGCPTEPTPALLLSHENTCKYKPVNCLYPCKWQDTVDKLYEHYNSAHPGSIIEDTSKFDITDKPRYFLHACNEVFLVSVLKTSKGIDVFVCPVNPSKTIDMYNYDIKFHSKWTAKLPDNLEHENCLHAMIDFSSVIVNPATFACEVNVNEKSVSNMISKLHVDIMQRIKCTLCAKGVAPPIYSCCSYIYCEVCILQQRYCQTCSSKITECRNLAIEEIVEECTYSCKYDGCTHLLSAVEKKGHESQCDFRLFTCPICTTTGLFEDLWNHIKIKHRVVLNNDLIKFGGSTNLGLVKMGQRQNVTINIDIVKYDSSIFVIMAYEKYFSIALLLGPNPIDCTFFYTLKLVRDNHEQICIKRKCEGFISFSSHDMKYMHYDNLITKINFEQIVV